MLKMYTVGKVELLI